MNENTAVDGLTIARRKRRPSVELHFQVIKGSFHDLTRKHKTILPNKRKYAIALLGLLVVLTLASLSFLSGLPFLNRDLSTYSNRGFNLIIIIIIIIIIKQNGKQCRS